MQKHSPGQLQPRHFFLLCSTLLLFLYSRGILMTRTFFSIQAYTIWSIMVERRRKIDLQRLVRCPVFNRIGASEWLSLFLSLKVYFELMAQGWKIIDDENVSDTKVFFLFSSIYPFRRQKGFFLYFLYNEWLVTDNTTSFIFPLKVN